jgi:hypothetical protein
LTQNKKCLTITGHMTAIDKLIRILELHEYSSDMESFKRYATNKQHSQLLVEDVWCNWDRAKSPPLPPSTIALLGSEWIDASEWDKQQCLDFLGY